MTDVELGFEATERGLTLKDEWAVRATQGSTRKGRQMGDDTLNIRGVDSATKAMFKRLAGFREASYADMLTLVVGEYAATHEDELVAWARGETD